MFDSELDKSLWFILEADVDNRKDIIDFLKRIPVEMQEAIIEILMYQDCDTAKKERDEDLTFKGSISGIDGMEYSYEIYYHEDEKILTIRQELPKPINGETPHMNFSIELLLASDLFPYDLGEEYYVGDFTRKCTINNINKLNTQVLKEKFMPFLNINNNSIKGGGYEQEQEFEYNLINDGTKYSIIKSKLFGNRTVIPIDITQLPDEISMDYIDQRYGDSSMTKKPQSL